MEKWREREIVWRDSDLVRRGRKEMLGWVSCPLLFSSPFSSWVQGGDGVMMPREANGGQLAPEVVLSGIDWQTSLLNYGKQQTHAVIHAEMWQHHAIWCTLWTFVLSVFHRHTHTHIVFLWFTGTLHRRNGFYTVQTVCAIALHLTYTYI